MFKIRSVLFLALLMGCADTQMGLHALGPIRRCIVHKEGDAIATLRDGTVVFSAKTDMYFEYIDCDDNGSFNCDVDQIAPRNK